MKSLHAILYCFLALILGTICANVLRGDEPVWKPIADGKTLEGWHENGLGEWTVEDGAYVGRSNNEKLYGHLVSDQQYQDFTVRFKFWCTSGDSGFFVRTKMEEPDKTLGLQIQVGPCGSGTGGIYESYGRGWLQQPKPEEEKSCYREGTWNDMIISAHGPKVSVHVNGIKTADLNDDKISQQAGVFALQMHSGVVNHTMFKDLAILEQGEITPKKFLYDAVLPVGPGDDGKLVLDAASGLGVGPQVTYLPDVGAFTCLTGKDRIEWPLQVEKDGRYEVWVEWSASNEQAGKPFELSLGHETISGQVPSTGSAKNYHQASIGQVNLTAGTSRAILSAGNDVTSSIGNLRRFVLVPIGR